MEDEFGDFQEENGISAQPGGMEEDLFGDLQDSTQNTVEVNLQDDFGDFQETAIQKSKYEALGDIDDLGGDLSVAEQIIPGQNSTTVRSTFDFLDPLQRVASTIAKDEIDLIANHGEELFGDFELPKNTVEKMNPQNIQDGNFLQGEDDFGDFEETQNSINQGIKSEHKIDSELNEINLENLSSQFQEKMVKQEEQEDLFEEFQEAEDLPPTSGLSTFENKKVKQMPNYDIFEQAGEITETVEDLLEEGAEFIEEPSIYTTVTEPQQKKEGNNELFGDLILVEVPISNLDESASNLGEKFAQQGEDEFGDFADFAEPEAQDEKPFNLSENHYGSDIYGEIEELGNHSKVEGEPESQSGIQGIDFHAELPPDLKVETRDVESNLQSIESISQPLNYPDLDDEFGMFEDPEIQLKTAEQAKLLFEDQEAFSNPSMFDTGTSSHELGQQSKNNLVHFEDIILENQPQSPSQKISADFQMDSVSEIQNITDSMHGISTDTNEP